MQQVAFSVLVASAVFFGLMIGFDVVVRSATLTSETIMSNVFKTIIFAMAFAAIKVGTIIFKNNDPE